MTKELFIESIEAIQKQTELNSNVAFHLSNAFPDAFEATLLPQSDIVINALIRLLSVEMNDNESWIEYFLWELDFGKENYRLKIMKNGKELKMSTSEELYKFLVNNNEKGKEPS